jgi:hypothetical protein
MQTIVIKQYPLSKVPLLITTLHLSVNVLKLLYERCTYSYQKEFERILGTYLYSINGCRKNKNISKKIRFNRYHNIIEKHVLWLYFL